MVNFCARTHVYEGAWEHVTSAFWNKYPNSVQKHVKSVDTV